MSNAIAATAKLTIGFDLGTRKSQLFALSSSGEIVSEETVPTTRSAIQLFFGGLEPARVIIEAGPVTRWVKELLEQCGHEVIVANPREIALIYGSVKKNDKSDAEKLARLGRADLKLLHPVELRSTGAQTDLSLLRTRSLLVSQRTELINHTRSLCRSFGYPLPSCDAHYFHRKIKDQIPQCLEPALSPAVEQIKNLTAQIKSFDNEIERLAEDKYPRTKNLAQIQGVGTLTALAFVLTLGNPERFKKSRLVGAYLGLVPRLDSSSERNPQLRITKAGDSYLRHLLVQAAHYILGPNGEASDLRRHGLNICPDHRNKGAKKRSVIAVARKLSVLMHHLWSTGETYDRFYNSKPGGRMKTKSA